MREVFYVFETLTLLVSVVLACALVVRDPHQRINSLMAVVPALLALWCLGEIAWNLQSEVKAAEVLIRATAGAWLLLGPACLHVFAELARARHPLARRLVPISYFASVAAFLFHFVTGIGLAEIVPTPWGWRARLDLGFLVPYAALTAPMAYLLLASAQTLPGWGARRERRVWTTLHAAVAAGILFATTTNIVLPVLGIVCPPLGTTSVLLITLCIAYQFKRHGYALMAPSTFASEILEALGDGVVMLSANGRVRIANRAFQRLVGASEAQVLDVPFVRFAPSLDVEPRCMNEDVECDLVSRSAGAIPVLISPTRLRNPSGGTRATALVIRDLREVSALRGNLVASDRLAMVGALSASIAEEIREPVQEARSHLEGIRAHLGSLKEVVGQCADTEKLDELVVDREELIEECIEGIERIEAIVHDVRGFTANRGGPREDVDLNALIDNAVRIARARAGSEIEIEECFEVLQSVPCVPGEIVQVLINLLINAIYATDGRGRIQLSSWQHDHEVWICIEDDGCGIPREIMSRIFDPFFTTKPVGDGTGLGLAISHHIIRNHGGDLRVESEQGRGSRFTLSLPLDRDVPCGGGAVSGVLSR
ncbi:MAG: PAS domain-containing protein [bacterium]|nr:PAS domain-containing protein [bacterium]